MVRDPPEPIAPRADKVQASTTKSFMAEMVKEGVDAGAQGDDPSTASGGRGLL